MSVLTKLDNLVAGSRGSQQVTTLWVGLGLSTICSMFFAIDILGDIVFGGDFPGGELHRVLEAIVVVVSLSAFAFHVRELRVFFARHQKVSDQVRVASGEFAEVVEELFSSWGLTPAERDVAIFLVKGVGFKGIAANRDAKEGTVKAQANAIYRKAGVSSRHELVALFLDEMLYDAGES